MKRLRKTISLAAVAFGVCLLGVGRAEAQVTQVVSCSGIELRQTGDPNTPIDNGRTSTVKPPERFVFTTETLLEDLALDETTNGSWFNTNAAVPRNARLEATFAGQADFSSLSLKVVSGTNTVDVSNILSASLSGANDVTFSTFADATGVPFNATDYHVYTLTYNGPGAGGKLTFTVTGLATSSAVATAPNARTGIYSERDSFSVAGGTGSGVDATGAPFVLSGVTVTASGSGRGDCGCGSDEGFSLGSAPMGPDTGSSSAPPGPPSPGSSSSSEEFTSDGASVESITITAAPIQFVPMAPITPPSTNQGN